MRVAEVDSIYELMEKLNWIAPYADLWYRGSSNLDYGLLPGLVWRNDTEWEANYVHKFLVGYQAYADHRVTNPWEQYALMQHHGLPTRLLDWSSSPLSAIFFALHQGPESDTDRVVWILDPREFNNHFHNFTSIICPAILASTELKEEKNNPDSEPWNVDAYLPRILDKNDHYKLPGNPIAIDSPYSNKRLAAQHGRFTLHGSNNECLHKQLEACENDKVLSAFVLKSKGRLAEFKEQLYTLGINEETIYQDLDSLARNIIRQEYERK
jgi:hypothetical protein